MGILLRPFLYSMIAPQEMLIAVAVNVRALSDAAKAATLPTSVSVAARFSNVAFSIPAAISSFPAKPSAMVSGTPRFLG